MPSCITTLTCKNLRAAKEVLATEAIAVHVIIETVQANRARGAVAVAKKDMMSTRSRGHANAFGSVIKQDRSPRLHGEQGNERHSKRVELNVSTERIHNLPSYRMQSRLGVISKKICSALFHTVFKLITWYLR